MSKKNFKSDKGVTLIILTVYIIVMSLVIGSVGLFSTFFSLNISEVRQLSNYSYVFDKFNSNFLQDVKANKKFNINLKENIIVFEDVTMYKYNKADRSIYRGNVKIANKILDFRARRKNIEPINGVNKQVISINMVIGMNDKKVINKQVDYTLKYW